MKQTRQAIWAIKQFIFLDVYEQHTLKYVNNCINRNIYSYLEASGGESSNPYLNVAHFLNTRAD